MANASARAVPVITFAATGLQVGRKGDAKTPYTVLARVLNCFPSYQFVMVW